MTTSTPELAVQSATYHPYLINCTDLAHAAGDMQEMDAEQAFMWADELAARTAIGTIHILKLMTIGHSLEHITDIAERTLQGFWPAELHTLTVTTNGAIAWEEVNHLVAPEGSYL